MHGHPSDLRAAPPPAALRGGRPAAATDSAAAEGGVDAVLAALGDSGQQWLRLLGGELRLSAALWLRAAALLVLALLLGAVSTGLLGALLVAIGLSLGLGWPASLALAVGGLVLGSFGCLHFGKRLLGESGLKASRRQLRLLWAARATSS